MPDRRARWILLGLLACNTLYYLLAGRLSEALDSIAWYVLLILFTVESLRALAPRTRLIMRVLRAPATLAIAVSAALYVREQAWLDAANLFLWIAVVLLLEVEVRRPAMVSAYRRAFGWSAAALYAGLALLTLIWLARGEWMDAWDAALWLTAFGLLELNLLGRNSA